MVTLEFPAFVKVTLCVLLLETLTLPKLRLFVLEFSMRVVGAVTLNEAALLVTEPAALLTTTVNCAALSEAAAAGVV
jgi:hypothetical protein